MQTPSATHTLNLVASLASPARRTYSSQGQSLDSKSCGESRTRVRFGIFDLASLSNSLVSNAMLSNSPTSKVVFANSVLGARTEKYADYFDICSALAGFVPNVGMHVARNRVPNVVIDATDLIRTVLVPSLDDNDDDVNMESFFPAMGWLCGNLSDGAIPLIIGFESISYLVTIDALKAFCAAFGTTGSSPLFHLANITPEAREMSDIEGMLASCGDKKVVVSKQDLLHAYETLDSGRGDGDEISLVALGNPHLSRTELQRLSALVASDSRGKHPGVRVMACLGRQVQMEGKEHVEKLETFGVEFVNDTCWCMLLDVRSC